MNMHLGAWCYHIIDIEVQMLVGPYIAVLVEDCGNPLLFSAGIRQFLIEKQFSSCPLCTCFVFVSALTEATQQKGEGRGRLGHCLDSLSCV